MTAGIDLHKWCGGRVVELYSWARRLYSLRVEAEIGDFEAGQFGRLGLEIGEEFVSRPYSFVNAPDQRPLDFYFIVIPEGRLTPRLAALRPGELVWVARKGAGFFTLRQVPEGRFLWLLATGTALGPFLSILRTAEPWQRFAKVVLVHGVRTSSELAYRETIEGFRRDHPHQFRFFASVTRQECRGAFSMRIPQAIEAGVLEQAAGIRLAKDSQVMICGNPAMVRDTVALLKSRGLRENLRRQPGQVTTERYW